MLAYSTGGNLEQLYELLFRTNSQWSMLLTTKEDSDEIKTKAERLTLDFIESIPETRRLLLQM